LGIETSGFLKRLRLATRASYEHFGVALPLVGCFLIVLLAQARRHTQRGTGVSRVENHDAPKEPFGTHEIAGLQAAVRLVQIAPNDPLESLCFGLGTRFRS
jgi:hypothetical protein